MHGSCGLVAPERLVRERETIVSCLRHAIAALSVIIAPVAHAQVTRIVVDSVV